MNEEPKYMVANAVMGVAGAGISTIADHFKWLDPAIRAITFYGGAVLVVFSIVSVGIDLWRKWHLKERKERKGRRLF